MARIGPRLGSMATKDSIAALGVPPVPERWIGLLLGGRDGRLLIVAIGALLGRPLGIRPSRTTGLRIRA